MSAPIRPIDASSQGQAAKKVFRRKKIGPLEQSDPFQFGHQQQLSPPLPPQYKPKFIVERRDERPSTCRPKIKVSKVPTQTRARSAVSGSDIVTLVSLLSPGGSDSEREEHSIKGDVACTDRGGPSLRKIGKSGGYAKGTHRDRYVTCSISFQFLFKRTTISSNPMNLTPLTCHRQISDAHPSFRWHRKSEWIDRQPHHLDQYSPRASWGDYFHFSFSIWFHSRSWKDSATATHRDSTRSHPSFAFHA